MPPIPLWRRRVGYPRDRLGEGNVACSGTELVITGGITDGTFYGARVSRVLVEERSVPFTRTGDYVSLRAGGDGGSLMRDSAPPGG
jgi:hypothetical protein